MNDDRDALYPPGSLTGARRPGLTGSSYDDLPKMAAWVRDNPQPGHVDRDRAFAHDPGPMNGAAEVGQVPRADIGRLVDRRAVTEDAMQMALSGLDLLLGPGVGASVRSVYAAAAAAAAAIEVWQMRRADQAEGTIGHLREIIDSRERDTDRARDLAARLEEEVARLTDPWIGRYLQALEDAVGEERRELLVAQVNEAWRAAGSPTGRPAADVTTVALPDTGLPVVDDASLAEGELQFRAGVTLVAVGRLDRLFAPLDTATEIALGAQQADVPDAEHPLDEGSD